MRLLKAIKRKTKLDIRKFGVRKFKGGKKIEKV